MSILNIFKKKTEAISELLPDEPAKKNYFLDKGFSDLGATIRGSFCANGDSIVASANAIQNHTGGLVSKILSCVLHLVAICAIAVFGTIITLAFSFIHSLAVAAVMLFTYISLGISLLADSIYIRLGRVAVVCDKCKARSVHPGYICPGCGKIHYRLYPNVYGIFVHTCECGQRLPAAFYVRTKDKATGLMLWRKKLKAICANPKCSAQVFSEETHPLAIPVVGSPSVGKTAYLTAVTYDLIERALPESGSSVRHYTSEKEAFYQKIKKDYAQGQTAKTMESEEEGDPSAFSLSFFIDNPSLKPSRLVHLFDIAGETFVRNAERERQLQYSYADGIILIVDPLAIPEVYEECEGTLNDVDGKSIGGDDLNVVLASLVSKIQNAQVLASDQKAKASIAVVINKIDEPGVSSYFSQSAQDAYRASHADIADEDIVDGMCRQFFRDKGAGNFANTLEVNFSTVRYFAISAIGHSRGSGAYKPQGVLDPLRWILSLADKPLANILNKS